MTLQHHARSRRNWPVAVSKLKDGAAATQVKVDVTNNATVIVQQDAVLGAFISLVAFLDSLVIRLFVKAVEVSTESIKWRPRDLEDGSSHVVLLHCDRSATCDCAWQEVLLQ